MKKIILFDMDGTLTPPRKKVSREIIKKLKQLSFHADIGIVTGSGYDYLIQQCKEIWYDIGTVDSSKIILLPCNGTQVYSTSKSPGVFKPVSKESMRKKLGDDVFDKLVGCLVHMQFLHVSKKPDHPLTGHFISYRDSLVNWCPVGRNATDEQRKKFIEYDNTYNSRLSDKVLLEKLLDSLGIDNITLALGGSTSVDIFPTGWDKTYCLNHLKDYECWFVGDSCTNEGNDRTIYEKLKKDERAFITKDPEDTIKIIDYILEKIKE